jgi:hypothetical protein
MKKIIMIIAAVSVAFSSCSDMLEETNYGNATEEEIFKNPDTVIFVVGQAYADVKWLHDHWGYWGINTLTSDECVNPVRMPGSHWNDGGYWSSMNNHNWTPSSQAFNNVWNKSVAGAVLCNKTLATLKTNEQIMKPEIYAQFVGELEVLRSYYYYTLFDCFGRIPYTEEFRKGSVPQMPAIDVWKKLVDCLEKNAPNLPAVTDANRSKNYGRVTQGFAYALLARLYLNAESYGVTGGDNYTKCVEACDKVIGYSIEDNFFTNFKINNETSKENIFVIVEDGNAGFDERSDNSMMNKLRINSLTLHYCHQTPWKLIEKPWNGFCAPQEFIDRYEATDVRGPGNEGLGTNNTQQWGWFLGAIYDAAGEKILKDENGDEAIITKEITTLNPDKEGPHTWGQGARSIKYEVDKEGKYKYSENDFVLFRYADVLYMKGEAIANGGAGTFDWTSGDVAKIRTRAGLAAYTSTPSLDEILDERGREFAWENVRRRDLIRFGKFADGKAVNNGKKIWGDWRGVKTDNYLNWFPIPQQVLEKAPRENGKAIWTQNPGYE